MLDRTFLPGYLKLTRPAVTFLMILLYAACSETTKADKMTDNLSLDQYINLPFDYDTVNIEIVTLPEPGDSRVPGPTDFVALVAAISSTPEARDAYVASLPAAPGALGVPKQFLRPWLDAEQVHALRTIGAGNESTRDVSEHLTKRAKRALAVPAGDAELVLYLEFVAPW